MGGTAPANQLRLSFTGSEDGEAETETCRVAKPLWRTMTRTSGPLRAQLTEPPYADRTYGGVAGESERPLPLCRLPDRRLVLCGQVHCVCFVGSCRRNEARPCRRVSSRRTSSADSR